MASPNFCHSTWFKIFSGVSLSTAGCALFSLTFAGLKVLYGGGAEDKLGKFLGEATGIGAGVGLLGSSAAAAAFFGAKAWAKRHPDNCFARCVLSQEALKRAESGQAERSGLLS